MTILRLDCVATLRQGSMSILSTDCECDEAAGACVPAPSDKRASIVELTDSGKALAGQVKQLWRALAEETVTGLPAQTVAELPGVLKTLTGNVDTRRPRHPHGRRDGG